MGYVDTTAFVKSVFPEAIEIASVERIDMHGTYLLLDSTDKFNFVQDRMAFVLVIAGHAFGGETGIAGVLDEYRKRVLDHHHEIDFEFIKRVELRTETLFSVAFGFSVITV